jgi:hypothetical protein
LVASSKAHRLKSDAIDIRVDVDPVHWFLDGKEDTRSSYSLPPPPSAACGPAFQGCANPVPSPAG